MTAGRRTVEIAIGILPIALLIALWHALAASGATPAAILPPPAAVFARRWSVAPLPADPVDTLVLQVFVTRTATDARVAAAVGAGQRLPLQGDALLATVSTRRLP